MTARLIITLLAALSLLAAPALAKAPTGGAPTKGFNTQCSSNPALVNCQTIQNPNKNPNLNIVNKIGLSLINFILYIGGALAIIFIIIGGMQYIISAGDPGRIASAKATLQYAIGGLVVIILAYSIVTVFVKSL